MRICSLCDSKGNVVEKSLFHRKILRSWEVCVLSALIPETTSIVLPTQMKSYIDSRVFEKFQTRQ